MVSSIDHRMAGNGTDIADLMVICCMGCRLLVFCVSHAEQHICTIGEGLVMDNEEVVGLGHVQSEEQHHSRCEHGVVSTVRSI
jgi:hypothetical protein